MTTFTHASRLDVSPADFWADQSLSTVNYELKPWIYMTAPKKWQAMRQADWQGGDVLLSSWVLSMGVLPVNRHVFRSFAFAPETGFVEVSSSWVNRLWRHERTLAATESGCVVRGTVAFTSSRGLVSPFSSLVIHLSFATGTAGLRPGMVA